MLEEVPLGVNKSVPPGNKWKQMPVFQSTKLQFESVIRPLARADMRLALVLALGVFLVAAAFLAPTTSSVDEDSMLAVSQSLVSGFSFSVPYQEGEHLGEFGRNGQYYSDWYPLPSIIAMPTTAVGLLAARAVHFPARYLVAICGMVLSAAILAACAAIVLILVLRMGGDAADAVFAGLAYAFGTIAFEYSRTFYAEPLLALMTAVAVLCVFSRSKTAILSAAFACALCVLAKPTGIVVGPPIALYLFLRREKLSRAVLPAVGTSVGLLVYFAYNLYRFGRPLDFGQPLDFELSGFGNAFLGLLDQPRAGAALLLSSCAVDLRACSASVAAPGSGPAAGSCAWLSGAACHVGALGRGLVLGTAIPGTRTPMLACCDCSPPGQSLAARALMARNSRFRHKCAHAGLEPQASFVRGAKGGCVAEPFLVAAAG